jgi:hypothetical protein
MSNKDIILILIIKINLNLNILNIKYVARIKDNKSYVKL